MVTWPPLRVGKLAADSKSHSPNTRHVSLYNCTLLPILKSLFVTNYEADVATQISPPMIQSKTSVRWFNERNASSSHVVLSFIIWKLIWHDQMINVHTTVNTKTKLSSHLSERGISDLECPSCHRCLLILYYILFFPLSCVSLRFHFRSLPTHSASSTLPLILDCSQMKSLTTYCRPLNLTKCGISFRERFNQWDFTLCQITLKVPT